MAVGPLVLIGGAEDKHGDCVILRRVVELAGGPAAHLVVLTTAALRPDGVGDEYRRVFEGLGAGRVETVHVGDRRAAGDPGVLELVGQATAVFFTGGDQLRITSTLGGTPLGRQLHARHRRGLVVAGTSAGASAMTATMIVEGDSERAPKRCTVKMAPGMGFLAGAVVDQHFAQRGRIGRLLSAVAQNPDVLGIGIDENTAVELHPDGRFSVVGSETVTVVDGRSIQATNASESRPGEPLALTHVVVHVLPQGYAYHLRSGQPRHTPPQPRAS